MKKLLVILISFMPMLASADYLDTEISELIRKKQDLIAQLEECEESVGGLKIAGLVTLGVSTIGVATNIGEAVALKGLQSDVETAKATKANLDTKISKIKIEIAANDTCGGNNCVGDGVLVADGLNGTGPVCINDVWAVKLCKVGFNGVRPKTCKRNGVAITYYDACTKDVLFDSCGAENCDSDKKEAAVAELNGSGALCVNNTWTVQTCNQGYIGEKKTCNRNGVSYDYYFSCFKDPGFDSCGTEYCNDGSQAEAEARLHGAPAVCINNNWAVRSCNLNYTGKEEQCNRNGELITYYHQCIEQDGRNTCGSNNCVGSVDPALNGSVPICVGDRWRVTVCNEGYSGKTSTCTRNGVTETYYANGCSKVIVPDGVTVGDLGNGQYYITLDKGEKTTNEGDKSTVGDSNSYMYFVTSDGGIAKVDGKPGNYTYTTHNGDVYNIENLIYSGDGSFKSKMISGSVPVPVSVGIDFGSETINLGNYTCASGIVVDATSSDESVVKVIKNDNNISLEYKKPGNAQVTVQIKCGKDVLDTHKYNITVPKEGEEVDVEIISGNQKGTKFASKKTSPQNKDILNINIKSGSENEVVNNKEFTVTSASQNIVGPCHPITESFNAAVLYYYNNKKPRIGLYSSVSSGADGTNDNLFDLDTNYYKVAYAAGGSSKRIRQMIYSCPDSRYYPVYNLDKYGNIILTDEHFERSFCKDSCPGNQGAWFEYEGVDNGDANITFEMYSNAACYFNAEHALEICRHYCEKNGKPNSSQFSIQSCTTDVVAIKNSICMCNQNVIGAWAAH
jgi:hypothetical protein